MPAITSLKGNAQNDAASHIQSNLEQPAAVSDFQSLRTLVSGNATSTAQIKLVHTTDADRFMEFQTKNWFSRTFSSQQKLVNTNAAILALVKKTGLSENSASFVGLKTYLSEKTEQHRAGSARGLHQHLEAIYKELNQKPATQVTEGRSVAESLKAQGYEFAGLDDSVREQPVASGGNGRVYAEAGDGNKAVIYKEFHNINSQFLPKLRVRSGSNGGYQMDRNEKDHAAVSLRNGKVPHVASPLAYVIEDSLDDMFHTIGVDHMKDWVAKNGESIFRNPGRYIIKGQVQPKAEGKEGSRLKDLAKADRQAIAWQGLEALRSMAEHGYVHGDIKPDNLIYNRETKGLKLIDFDGLIKQSKQDASGLALGNPLSPRFVIPSEHHPDGAKDTGGYGYEADLYAFGLTLLSLYLPGAEPTKALLGDPVAITDRKAAQEPLQALRADTDLVRPGSPEDLAVRLLELSLEQDVPLTGRLGSGNNPTLDLVWEKIDEHPVMRGQG